MIKDLRYATIIFLILAIIIFLTACGSCANTAPAYSGTYFGYYGSGFSENTCYPRCSSLHKDKGNVIWLRAESATILMAEIAEAKANSLYAIVSIQDIPLKDLCSLVQGLSNVASYYIADEPYWNNQGVNIQTVKAELESKIAVIHACAPGIPTSIIFSAPESLDPEFPDLVPVGLDWAGFDCYLADDTYCTNAVVSKLLDLFDTLGPKQILVPDAMRRASTETEDDIIARIKMYQKHKSVAIFPFLYQTIGDMQGADSMPKVADYLRGVYDNQDK